MQSLTHLSDRTPTERPSGSYARRASPPPLPTKSRKSPPPLPAKSPKHDRQALRAALQVALNERRYTDALTHVLDLVALDPADPRWPHKYGDVLRTLRRNDEAAAVYRRAAKSYEAAGFPVRAAAMMRSACELDGENAARAATPKKLGQYLVTRRIDATAPA